MPRTLRGVQKLLKELGANASLIGIAGRKNPLVPFLPPACTEVGTRHSTERLSSSWKLGASPPKSELDVFLGLTDYLRYYSWF